MRIQATNRCLYWPFLVGCLPLLVSPWIVRRRTAIRRPETRERIGDKHGSILFAHQEDSAADLPPRMRRKVHLEKGKCANILSRCVPITPTWNLTVWEWEKPAAVVETYWQVEQQGLSISDTKPRLLDPFGLVTWPGSVVAVGEMLRYPDTIIGKKVLILGAGVGLEAQAAAIIGAETVLATDIHPTTLQLLQYGTEEAGLDDVIETRMFDIFSESGLPYADTMIVADVLYNERLAKQVRHRCIEAVTKNMTVLLSDSQRFVSRFDAELSRQLSHAGHRRRSVAWSNRWLTQFTGSGVLIDADQTYDVKARVLWLGLEGQKDAGGQVDESNSSVELEANDTKVIE